MPSKAPWKWESLHESSKVESHISYSLKNFETLLVHNHTQSKSEHLSINLEKIKVDVGMHREHTMLRMHQKPSFREPANSI